ncbi:MAG: hypothetical protein F4X64_06650 [Chloroflexi bacterium]|nr:hypothetical protein [Chloroflexota bacterium]
MSPAERTRFLRALQDDPEFRAEVRRQLLSKELLELPERFARFAAYVEGFIEDQKRFNEDQKIINARVDATLARIETNIARIETNIGVLKGNVARRVLRDHHETILDLLQLDFVDILQRSDLTRLVRDSGMANEIEFGQRRSFYAADMVLAGTDAAGDTHYVAAEASFTADSRDTDRAIRNAAFLTRFTGQPSHSVVASVFNDHEVQELVNAGAIHWFRLDEREFDAD